MNVTSEKVAEGQVALTIEVEPEAVEKAMNQAYQRLVVKTLVPGFRKGKAPRPMLERYMGHGALLEEALQRLIPQVFAEVYKEQDITPYAEPKYEIVQVEPVIVKATVDLPPVVELGSYNEIRASLTLPEVTEENVNNAIEQFRDSVAVWEPVERPVEMGDRVTSDIEAAEDGTEIFNRQNFAYTVSTDNQVPVPGLAERLVGMSKGEEREFDLSFPEDHQDKTVAGHAYHIRVKVSDIKAKRLPPLDDEFAKSAGEGFETLEGMRKQVRENIATANDRQAKEELVRNVLRELVDLSKFEIPPSMVDHEVHRILEDEDARFRSQRFSLGQYLSMVGQTFEQHHEELMPVARDTVKRSLAIGKVTEAENITVEPDEIEAGMLETVNEAGPAAEAFRKFFATPEGRDSVERSIRSRKTVHRLIEIATEGAVDYPELPRAVAEAGAEAEGAAGTESGETTQGSEPAEPETEKTAQE